MVVLQKKYEKLFEAALKARENSCSPYSGFKVGAAVLTESGRIYSGCNIESSSFGLTMCAERNALSAALCAGEKDISAVLVTADTPDPVSPCGACRQLIYDYAPDARIILTNLKRQVLEFKIEEMLKYPFGKFK
ncbi:MAG TPA: cytidine deaminase [Clostridiales bacterium]|mgnify:CR=1 FL=1|nr:cytidine deaminase [Clostridiales bacterium]HQP70909.1 cytidine deaminase [Clostridiales bacterium]